MVVMHNKKYFLLLIMWGCLFAEPTQENNPRQLESFLPAIDSVFLRPIQWEDHHPAGSISLDSTWKTLFKQILKRAPSTPTPTTWLMLPAYAYWLEFHLGSLRWACEIYPIELRFHPQHIYSLKIVDENMEPIPVFRVPLTPSDFQTLDSLMLDHGFQPSKSHQVQKEY